MNVPKLERVPQKRRMTGALLSLLLVVALTPASPLAVDNPIVLENQQPGSGNWMWSKLTDDTAQQIKGYASATSVNQNENLTFFVTVNPVQSFTIDFYRFGWYAGAGARLQLDPELHADRPDRLDERRLRRHAHQRSGLPEFRDVRRPGRPPGPLPLPAEHRDGSGVQRLSQRRPHRQESLWLQQLRGDHGVRHHRRREGVLRSAAGGFGPGQLLQVGDEFHPVARA